MKKVLICTAAVAALAGVSGSASAHHSFAMFDATKQSTLVGVVKEFQYTNPHAWLLVVVGNTTWALEAEGPSTLLRAGIKKNTLKPGEKVTFKFHPLKDGRNGGALINVVKADGTVIDPKTAEGSTRPASK